MAARRQLKLVTSTSGSTETPDEMPLRVPAGPPLLRANASGTEQRFSRESVGHQFALFNQHSSVDDHKLHARAWLHRRLVGGVVGDGLGVKNDDVGIGSLLQTTLQTTRRSGFLQPLSGHKAHLADGGHERDASLFADIIGQNAGVSACVARMAFFAVT